MTGAPDAVRAVRIAPDAAEVATRLASAGMTQPVVRLRAASKRYEQTGPPALDPGFRGGDEPDWVCS